MNGTVGRVIPFRRLAVAPTPPAVAEAELEWLAWRATGRPPAADATALDPGDELLGGAVAGAMVQPREDAVVIVRQFADGTLDVTVAGVDECGTLRRGRRHPLGRGPLMAKSHVLGQVLAVELGPG